MVWILFPIVLSNGDKMEKRREFLGKNCEKWPTLTLSRCTLKMVKRNDRHIGDTAEEISRFIVFICDFRSNWSLERSSKLAKWANWCVFGSAQISSFYMWDVLRYKHVKKTKNTRRSNTRERRFYTRWRTKVVLVKRNGRFYPCSRQRTT